MRNRLLVAAAILAASQAAVAQPAGHLDLYYSPIADLELDGVEFEGDGFGLKGAAPVSDSIVLIGEYQRINYDEASIPGVGSGDVDLDDDRFRFGAGFLPLAGPELQWGVFAEYVDLTLDGGGDEVEVDGFAISLRGHTLVAPTVLLYGQFGYLTLEDDANDEADGLEYLVGASFSLGPQVGLFVDYRITDLEADGGGDLKGDELRTGVRLNF
jgi:hypothetical protein